MSCSSNSSHGFFALNPFLVKKKRKEKSSLLVSFKLYHCVADCKESSQVIGRKVQVANKLKMIIFLSNNY